MSWRKRDSKKDLVDVEELKSCFKCGDACPGYNSHYWRKICRHCKCAREDHFLLASQTATMAVSSEAAGGTVVAPSGPSDEFAWAPPGLTPDQVQAYFSCLPEDRVPYSNSAGEKYRAKQLLHQLPPHDSDTKYCHNLSEEEKRESKLFTVQRKRDSLGRGKVMTFTPSLDVRSTACHQCRRAVGSGEVIVSAWRAGPSSVWHPACFVCTTCGELLVDLVYYYHENRLYCGRHHADVLKPRCAACDELIFAYECTEAEGRFWHMRHFCCFECDSQLGGLRYVMREERPVCCQCYERKFSDFCNSCGQLIGIDVGQMAYNGLHWHCTDTCFSCYSCGVPLQNKPFLPRNNEIYCSSNCIRGLPPTHPVDPAIVPRSCKARTTAAANSANDGHNSSTGGTLKSGLVRDDYGSECKVSHETRSREPCSDSENAPRSPLPTLSQRKSLSRPVLRVAPNHRSPTSTDGEVWIDMVPPLKDAVADEGHKEQTVELSKTKLDDLPSSPEGKLSGSAQKSRGSSRRGGSGYRSNREDLYYSDFEAERRKRSSRSVRFDVGPDRLDRTQGRRELRLTPEQPPRQQLDSQNAAPTPLSSASPGSSAPKINAASDHPTGSSSCAARTVMVESRRPARITYVSYDDINIGVRPSNRLPSDSSHKVEKNKKRCVVS